MANAVEGPQILSDEGSVRDDKGQHLVYKDSLGKLTGGFGHLLEGSGVKEGEPIPQVLVDRWFKEDLEEARVDSRALVPEEAPEAVKAVTTNLVFNLGKAKLRAFKGYLKAVKEKDYKRAAEELEWKDPDDHSKGNTPYWEQTGGRAKRLTERLKSLDKGS